MKSFQVFRMDRVISHFRDDYGRVFEELNVRFHPTGLIQAHFAEKALKLAQENHPFPHRLCVQEAPTTDWRKLQ